jgi:fibronectin-binding autotransporter adhesin
MVRRQSPLFAAIFALVFINAAPAQYSWNGSPNTDFWSSNANWTPTGPLVSGGTTTLTFGGGGISTDDLVAMILNSISINNSTTTGMFITPTVVGGAQTLTFGGTAPSLNQGGSTTAVINQPITLTAGTAFTLGGAGAGNLYLNGAFTGTATTTVTQTGPYRTFVLGTIGTAPQSWNINGGAMEFYGVSVFSPAAPIFLDNGGIFAHPGNVTGLSAANSAITIGANGGTLEIKDVGFIMTYAAGGNTIKGAGTFTKTGAGGMQFTGDTTLFTGPVVVNQGIMQVTSINGFGPTANTNTITVNSGGTIRFSTAATTTWAVTLLNRGNIAINGTGQLDANTILNGVVGQGALASVNTVATNVNTIANNFVMGSSSSINAGLGILSLTGVISENPAASGFSLSKDGAGTLRLSAANTYTGATNVVNGALSLQGAGTIASGTINVTGIGGGFNLPSVAQLLIDQTAGNPTLNRFSNPNAILNMRSSRLDFLAQVAAVASTQTIPTVNFDAGYDFVTVTPSATGTTVLTFTSLNRGANRPTAYFRSTTGSTLGTTGVGSAQIQIGNYSVLPTGDFIGTGSPTNLTDVKAPILRWAQTPAVATGNGTATNDFLTYGPNGLVPLAAGQYDNTAVFTAANAGNNMKLLAAGSQTADVAINSFSLNGQTFTQNNGTTLRINSGAIISGSGGTFLTAAGATYAAVETADQELIQTSAGFAFNGFVNSRNGLTRGGSTGTSILTLVNANAIYGPITLNGNSTGGGSPQGIGILAISNENQLGAMSNPITYAGGFLQATNLASTTWSRNQTIAQSGGQFALGSTTQSTSTTAGNDNGQYVTFSGSLTPVTGQTSGVFEKQGASVLELTGNNTFNNTIRLTGGLLRVTSNNNLGGAAARLSMIGSQNSTTVNAFNPVLWIGQSFTNTHPIAINNFGPQAGTANFNAIAFINVDSGKTLTQTGDILGGFPIQKAGPGTLAIESPIQFDGLFTVSGAPSYYQPNSNGSSLIFRGNGAMTNTGALVVAGGASTTLDNSASVREDRLARNEPVTLSGGTFNYIGNATAASYQHLGTLGTGAQSGSVINVTSGGSASTVLNFTTLSRGASSPLLFAGDSLGTGVGGGFTNILFDTVPAADFIGAGGAAGSTNRSIIRGALGDTSTAGGGAGLVTYDPRFGVRVLDAGFEYTTAIADGGVSTNNVRLAAASVAPLSAASTTINSLLLTGGSSVTIASGTPGLTVTSGTIASIGGSNSIALNLTFGAIQGYLLVNGGTLSVTGAITGTAGLAVGGTSGSLVFLDASGSGGNTFTGGLTIDRVTVQATPTSLGGVGGNGLDGVAIVFDNGGTLKNNLTPLNLVAGTGRQIVIGQGGGTFDSNSVASTTWDVGVNGIGRFTKTGAGNLTYSPTLSAGLRVSTTNGSYGNSGGSTGNFFGGIDVTGGSFTIGGAIANVLFPGAPINVSALATFRNSSGQQTIGSLTGSGTVDLSSSGAAALIIGSSFALTPTTTFSGNITGTASPGITKAGNGTLTLNPGSTLSDFTGPVAVQGGFLAIGGNVTSGSNGVLGAGTSAILVGQTSGTSFVGLVTTAAVSIDRDVTFQSGNTGLSIFGTQFAGVSSTGAIRTITIGQSGSAVNKTLQLTAPTGGSFEINSLIATGGTYSGIPTLEVSGGGQVVFLNGNSVLTAGRTILQYGELVVGADGTGSAGPIGVGPLVINGGMLSSRTAHQISNNVFVNSDFALGGIDTGALTLNGNVSLGAVGNSSGTEVGRTITVNNNTTVNGVVSGSSGFGALVKEGPGILNLTNNNTYPGRTTVNNGTLRLNNPNTGSGTGSGPVTVGVNGKIGGNGFVVPTLGSVTIAGTMDPGNSVGTLTFGSASTPATVTASGHYAFELSTAGASAPVDTGSSSLSGGGGGIHDIVTVFGTLNVTGLIIDPNAISPSGFNNTQSYSWTIATATGGVSGTPAPVTLGVGNEFAGMMFLASVVGNNLYLNFTPVPEPATVLAICAAGAGAFGLIRRRRKNTEVAA